ncbi:MAG: hypothetical protein ACU0DW_08560, partial [Shimia sp.]
MSLLRRAMAEIARHRMLAAFVLLGGALITVLFELAATRSGQGWATISAAVLYLLCTAALAVAWHRRLLTLKSPIAGRYAFVVIAYAWWLIISLLPLLAILVTVALVWPVVLSGLASPFTDALVSALSAAGITWFLLRCVLILPGLVVGEKVSLVDSWNGTRAQAWPIAGASVAIGVVSFPIYAIAPLVGD